MLCGKRTLEYVTDCVIKFNRSAEKVILRSVMGNLSKAMEVAQILKDYFGIIATPTKIGTMEIRGASKRKIV